jgi:5'-3' exonuclease
MGFILLLQVNIIYIILSNRGVVNWGWVYNYHYAPLVSDITNVEELINIHEPMTFDYMKEDNQYMLPLQQLLV